MTISPNEMIGSLVYRTQEALNQNKSFIENLKTYYFAQNCLINESFKLWHFPASKPEIENALTKITQNENEEYVKLPAILNFQSILQHKKGKDSTIIYNIAIAGSALKDWKTYDREKEIFNKILRPIHAELINQIITSGWFQLDYNSPAYDYYEVFTSNGNVAKIGSYGECIDAIELCNLTLKCKELTLNQIENITTEYNLVTQNIENIINTSNLQQTL